MCICGIRLLELELENCGDLFEHLFYNHRNTKRLLEVVAKRAKGATELCDEGIWHCLREYLWERQSIIGLTSINTNL